MSSQAPEPKQAYAPLEFWRRTPPARGCLDLGSRGGLPVNTRLLRYRLGLVILFWV